MGAKKIGPVNHRPLDSTCGPVSQGFGNFGAALETRMGASRYLPTYMAPKKIRDWGRCAPSSNKPPERDAQWEEWWPMTPLCLGLGRQGVSCFCEAAIATANHGLLSTDHIDDVKPPVHVSFCVPARQEDGQFPSSLTLAWCLCAFIYDYLSSVLLDPYGYMYLDDYFYTSLRHLLNFTTDSSTSMASFGTAIVY